MRWAKRRTGRSPDEDAIRGAFQTWFPNAQWVADGAVVDVDVGDHTCRFNVEPEGVDARYLLGCVRRVAEEREG